MDKFDQQGVLQSDSVLFVDSLTYGDSKVNDYCIKRLKQGLITHIVHVTINDELSFTNTNNSSSHTIMPVHAISDVPVFILYSDSSPLVIKDLGKAISYKQAAIAIKLRYPPSKIKRMDSLY